MREMLDVLKKNPLFGGIAENELEALLVCLGARRQEFGRYELIYREGQEITHIGIVLQGDAQIIREDIIGNRSLVSRLEAGDMFGEAFVCAGVKEIPVSVAAVTAVSALFMDYQKIISTCSSACRFHHMLIENMMKILAMKNVLANRRMNYLMRRTIREKIMTYFLDLAAGLGSLCFTLPLNREEMADFLCVNRSALSRELSAMQKQGLIKFDRNNFEIIKP